jgi:hypothetical protein
MTRQSLAEMAREFNIPGRSSMTKDDLIEAIRKSHDAVRRKKPATKDEAIDQSDTPETVRPKAKPKEASKPPRPRPATAKPKSPEKPKSSRPTTAANSKTSATKVPAAKVSSEPAVAAVEKVTAVEKVAVAKPQPTDINGKKSVRKRTAKPIVKDETAAVLPPPEPHTAKAEKPVDKAAAKVKKTTPKPPPAPPAPVSAKSKLIREEMRRRSQVAMQNKDLSTGVLVAGSAVRGSTGDSSNAPHKDRIVLIVRDSYWLQTDWEITRATVERVRVAMNEKWHKAVPVLRLLAVGDASSNRAEQQIRDIAIHGGVNTWFIDVENPPSRFRVVIGYLAENDRFFPLCRSNIVETPKPDAVHRLDRHWRDIAEDYERIYSLSGGYEPNSSGDLKEMFEERLQRQMPTRSEDGLSSDTDAALDRHRSLPFEVDAELIVYGSTIPGATVLLSGEPVKLREDGSFTVRVALPDKRQVLPIIAQSRDAMRQRTTVIAVERNTKVMEAVDRDQNF